MFDAAINSFLRAIIRRYVGTRNSSLVGKALRSSTISHRRQASRITRQEAAKVFMSAATKETVEDGDLVKGESTCNGNLLVLPCRYVSCRKIPVEPLVA